MLTSVDRFLAYILIQDLHKRNVFFVEMQVIRRFHCHCFCLSCERIFRTQFSNYYILRKCHCPNRRTVKHRGVINLPGLSCVLINKQNKRTCVLWILQWNPICRCYNNEYKLNIHTIFN